MRSSTVFRLALAAALAAALCGFKFVRQHITEAPIVDDATPFYGAGLVIGPAEQLDGVVKRAPLKFRMYKFLQRKGNTQYVPGLRRESDCSLTEAFADLADYTIVSTRANFQNVLRRKAGLTGPANQFPNGCTDAALGISTRALAGARTTGGGYFGAGPDFHADASMVVYRATAQTVLDHYDIALAPDGSNQYINDFAVADFNGDGLADYAVEVNAYGEGSLARIAILLGDGTGHFAAPTYVTLATSPPGSGKSASVVGMTIADFDGDTKLDFVATSDIGSQARRIAFVKGNGSGGFATPVTVADDIGDDLLAADFNGDDELDIASGDGYILFGSGTGAFSLAPGQRFDYGHLAAADFDGDGHIDLAVQAYTGDGSLIHVWKGDGSGQFARIDAAYGTGYGSGSADLLVSDLDGDGNADLIVGSGGEGMYAPGINSQGQTQFLLGRGDGTFASPPAYERALQIAADFTGDARPDLVAFESLAGTSGVRVLAGDGHGAFAPGAFTALGFGSPGARIPFAAQDLNGDGKIDLLGLEHWDSSAAFVHTRLGNGDGTFHASGPDLAVPFDVQGSYAGNGALPAIADLNGDGKRDLAMLGMIGTTDRHFVLYVLINNGDGSFASPQAIDSTLTGDGTFGSRVIAADLDNDGDNDLVLSDSGNPFVSPALPGSVRAYRNQGGGAFVPAPALAGPVEPDGLDVGDVNADGKADIVASGTPGANTLYVFLGNGDATFQPPRLSALPDIWFRSIVIGDADGDGTVDLTMGNCCGLTFGWFAHGEGNGDFAPAKLLPLVVSPVGMLLADLDANGHADLLVHNAGGAADDLRVYMNTWTDAIFASGFETK